jgi:cell division protein FtsQ
MSPGNRRVHPVSVMPGGNDGRVPGGAASTGDDRVGRGALLSALRTAAGIALVAGASVGVAWTARHHVMTSPRFAIAEVDVVGNRRRAADAIVGESGLSLGTNVFAADLDAARAKLLADPWIAELSLVRRLPGTIVVRVTEREPAALVALGDTFLATASGEPFKRLEASDPVDLPLVTGLLPESIADDREGCLRTIRRAIDLAAEYQRGSLSKRAPLEEVHVEPDGAFTLVVSHGAMKLVLGGPPFRRKLDQATRVVTELDRRGAKADAIMLDNDARPERVVVRMR